WRISTRSPTPAATTSSWASARRSTASRSSGSSPGATSATARRPVPESPRPGRPRDPAGTPRGNQAAGSAAAKAPPGAAAASAPPDPSDLAALAAAVKAHALALGFDLVGIADAAPFADAEARTLAWLARGGAAGMAWLTAERVRRACRPAELLPGARSFIAVAVGYRPAGEARRGPTPPAPLPMREGGEDTPS